MRISLRRLFRGLYRLCCCGCGKLINIVDKRGRPRRFLTGHGGKGKPFLFALKGENHYNWKGGRKKHGNYWMLLLPDYFSVQKNGYVYEHVYNYQEYYQCCILPWGVVHHIDPVRKGYCNNMVWNLIGMLRSKHITLHKKGSEGKKINMSGRFCKICKGKTRFISGYEHWYGNKENGWMCHKCYKRINKYY